jgi:hypothetical protein
MPLAARADHDVRGAFKSWRDLFVASENVRAALMLAIWSG